MRDLKYTRIRPSFSLSFYRREQFRWCSRKFLRKSVSIAVFSTSDNLMLTTRKRRHRKEDGNTRGEGILGAGEISENLWLRPPRISRRGERNILTRGRAIGKRADARSTSDGNGTEPSPGNYCALRAHPRRVNTRRNFAGCCRTPATTVAFPLVKKRPPRFDTSGWRGSPENHIGCYINAYCTYANARIHLLEYSCGLIVLARKRKGVREAMSLIKLVTFPSCFEGKARHVGVPTTKNCDSNFRFPISNLLSNFCIFFSIDKC